MYVCIYIRMYVCMYIYIYIYIPGCHNTGAQTSRCVGICTFVLVKQVISVPGCRNTGAQPSLSDPSACSSSNFRYLALRYLGRVVLRYLIACARISR
jgi:hypothetical protein